MYGTGSYGRGFNTVKILTIYRSDELDLRGCARVAAGNNIISIIKFIVIALYRQAQHVW